MLEPLLVLQGVLQQLLLLLLVAHVRGQGAHGQRGGHGLCWGLHLLKPAVRGKHTAERSEMSSVLAHTCNDLR